MVVIMGTSSIESLAGQQQCAPEANAVEMPGQPIAVAASAKHGFVAQLREPARLVFVGTNTSIDLGGDTRKDTAHDMFHTPPSGFGSIACASCHPEGSEDGRVWVFDAVGPRRTQTVAMGGVLSQTAPFHWSGDLHNLSALMSEVFSGRMGGGPVGERRARLMLKWLDTLPAPQASVPADMGAVDRGKALFHDEKVACSKCHGGGTLTNNRSENVGTGAQFQVPSLIGIASRAPFMHDGCAATLRERFDKPSCGGGDMHGVTSQLTEAQIDDLIAYLETL
jgi:mono/diheme cytochrome c family protein